MTRDQENATAFLGDSEILSIKHSRVSHIIAVGKLSDDRLNVLAIVGMEQGRHVLKDHPSGLNLLDDTHDLKEEAATCAFKTGTFPVTGAARADVLTRKARRDTVDPVGRAESPNVRKSLGARKSMGKHSPVDGVDLDLPRRGPASLFEAEVEPADPREE